MHARLDIERVVQLWFHLPHCHFATPMGPSRHKTLQFNSLWRDAYRRKETMASNCEASRNHACMHPQKASSHSLNVLWMILQDGGVKRSLTLQWPTWRQRSSLEETSRAYSVFADPRCVFSTSARFCSHLQFCVESRHHSYVKRNQAMGHNCRISMLGHAFTMLTRVFIEESRLWKNLF